MDETSMIQIEVTRVVGLRVEVESAAVIEMRIQYRDLASRIFRGSGSPEGDLKAMYRRHCSIDLTCQADVVVVDFRFPLACCVREQGATAAKIVVSIG